MRGDRPDTQHELGWPVGRPAAIERRRRSPPGERLAQELDAEVAGDHQRVGVGELQRGAEALLVLGIVDPALFPGVAGSRLQVAQYLRTADALAALGLVIGVLEPD